MKLKISEQHHQEFLERRVDSQSTPSETDRTGDIIFIEEHANKVNLLNSNKNKNLHETSASGAIIKQNSIAAAIVSAQQLINLNLVDSSQIFSKATSLIRSNSIKQNSKQLQQQQQQHTDTETSAYFKNASDYSLNNNYYFHYKNFQHQRNSSLSVYSANGREVLRPNNLISSSTDLIYNSNNSLLNSPMVVNRYQEPAMTQFTKYTKNVFTDSYNSQNGKLNKSPSRSSDLTNGVSGTPLSIINSASIQKSVLSPNTSPSNVNQMVKNDRIKASNLGRSVTMKYPKAYLDPNPQKQQTQHFNVPNRKSFDYSPVPTNNHQTSQTSIDNSSNSKKDFLSVLNNIQRSSSIKLGGEKTSLSNYFSSLSQNQNQRNSFINNSNMTLNLFSPSTNTNNSNSASFSKLSTKKQQPVSLRNSGMNTNRHSNADNANNIKNSFSLENVFNNLENLMLNTGAQSGNAIASNILLNQNQNQKITSSLLKQHSNSNHLLNRNNNNLRSKPQNENDESIEIKELLRPSKIVIVQNNKPNQNNETDEEEQLQSYVNTNEKNSIKKRESFTRKNKPTESKLSNNNEDQNNNNEAKPKPASQLSQHNSNNNNNVNKKAKENNINSNNNGNARLVRAASKLSHVTRDINDSYAYTNVKQYIEENDLMPPDKADSIKKWVREVNSCYDEWEKRTIEINIVED